MQGGGRAPAEAGVEGLGWQHAAFATHASGLTATGSTDWHQQQKLEPQNGHEPVPAALQAPDALQLSSLGQADAQPLLPHGARPPPGFRLATVLVPVELGPLTCGGALSRVVGKPLVP